MTTPNVPSGVLAIRGEGQTGWKEHSRSERHLQLGAFILRSRSPADEDDVSHRSQPQLMPKRSKPRGFLLLSVHTCVRPQVIHLSSELSEYLRPTDKLRAKVDSNLTMAISLDDPSLRIVHEIRGGWFGLALFMFGWATGVVVYDGDCSVRGSYHVSSRR
ncbi:hypothetical protein BKA70DRAFT_1237623 [Coprinopsis sp. MPI-PUGE-AT-0042]|nr:hypothetical protein BKA70DRAFT_1237623 [Coprinopsis sp. MPI-PUGE-AT-0042]